MNKILATETTTSSISSSDSFLVKTPLGIRRITVANLIASANLVVGGNTPPVASAGANNTITLPTSSVTLTGSGSDSDGTVASYLWTKVSGTGGTITTPSAATTTVTGLTAGSYVFRLTVTDNLGATHADDVTITVNEVAASFDSSLSFSSFTTDTDHGVGGTVSATDADLLFEFSAITPRIGNPMSMLLRVSATNVMVVDFFSDYEGNAFRFTDAAGVQHTGVFTDGTINF